MEFNQPLLGDFLAIVNHHPDMISRIDRDLNVIYVNDAVCKYSNKEREFFIGKKINEIFAEGNQTSIFCKKIEEVFSNGKEISYQMEGWSDDFQFLQFNIIPLEKEQGKVPHVLSIIKDITASRKHEGELKNSIKELEVISDQLIYQNKLLQDFAYITSHNLRSPLSNLKALINLYEIFELGSDEKKTAFDKIKLTLESLINTVNELSTSISEKGNLKKELENINFQKQLDEIKESLYSHIEDSGAVINTNFVKTTNILYPKLYIESIFLNLLTNSIKYRSYERPLIINIETKKERDTTILSWKDNGIGIDMKKYGSKLFGLKNTFHDRDDSRGIGLYITRNQIESVGGTISAESKLNEGCTFTIQFKDLTTN